MNAFEYEKKLLDNGFSGKDIAVLRQYLGKRYMTYSSIIDAFSYRYMILIVLQVIVFIVVILDILNDVSSLIPWVLTLLTIGPVFYFYPMARLALKAFRFRLKQHD